MNEIKISDIIFEEIDKNSLESLIFPTIPQQVNLDYSIDKTTNCYTEHFETLNKVYKFIEWINDETWQRYITKDLENTDMIIIKEDIIYDGNLDLIKLFENINGKHTILILGDIKITGTLSINLVSLYISGNIEADKILINPSDGSVFNGRINATSYIDFKSDKYFIWINELIKAPLILDNSSMILFLIGDIDSDTIIFPHNSYEHFEHAQKKNNFICLKKYMLKECYLDQQEIRYKRNYENNIIKDEVPIIIDRLSYAINNEIPYLKADADLSIE